MATLQELTVQELYDEAIRLHKEVGEAALQFNIKQGDSLAVDEELKRRLDGVSLVKSNGEVIALSLAEENAHMPWMWQPVSDECGVLTGE